MSKPHVKPGDIDVYLNDVDQPTCCPLCASRTQFLEQRGQQLHWCLAEKCGIIFMTEDDPEN